MDNIVKMQAITYHVYILIPPQRMLNFTVNGSTYFNSPAFLQVLKPFVNWWCKILLNSILGAIENFFAIITLSLILWFENLTMICLGHRSAQLGRSCHWSETPANTMWDFHITTRYFNSECVLAKPNDFFFHVFPTLIQLFLLYCSLWIP